MKVARVKNGIVGLGLVCDSHIKAYLSHSNAEVIAVCDLDRARAKAVADEFGIKEYYASYDEMLRNDEINTIDITTPTVLHAPMSIAAARAGKNILCEKPFCLTLEEGRAVCKEAERNGVTLMVGESYIFMTSIVKGATAHRCRRNR
jgi:predicted dehydrogenase